MEITIFKYGTSRCPACQALDQTLTLFESMGSKVPVVRYTDEFDLMSEKGIRSVPTLIVEKDGIERFRSTGNIALQKLHDVVEALKIED